MRANAAPAPIAKRSPLTNSSSTGWSARRNGLNGLITSPSPTTPRIAPIRATSTRVAGPCHGTYRRNRAVVWRCSVDVIDGSRSLSHTLGGYISM